MSLTLIPRVRTVRAARNWSGPSGYRGDPGWISGLTAGWQAGLPAHFVAAHTAHVHGAETSRDFIPRLEVRESDDGYTVSAELPGVKLVDIEIVLEDKVLTLKGKKTNGRENEEGDEEFDRFERRVAFRAPIAEDEVKARYADGLLTISLPKPAEARPVVRTVPVETG